MYKILIWVPDLKDATAYYRSLAPFANLRRKGLFDFIFQQTIDWTVIKFVDAVFMQRPYRSDDLKIAELTKEMNRPLWIDYDDDLFSVPPDNPSWTLYNHHEIQENISKILSISDLVTVSTPFLKNKLVQFNKNIVVVPNAFDEDLLQFPLAPKVNKKSLMWRGSNTHQQDLMEITPEIISWCHEHPEFTLEFCNFNPWFITDAIGRWIIHPAKDLINYFKFIRSTRGQLYFFPLKDNAFNRSKSNIAWVEATYAGTAIIAPSFGEWRRPGVISYSNAQEFKTLLTEHADIDTEPLVKLSWEYILDCLTLEKVNRTRETEILNLLA